MNPKFIVIAGRTGDTPPQPHYSSAYATYRTVWSETFREIHGEAYAYQSNDFTRQDYIQALYDGPTCIALDCVRKVRLDCAADLDDSWLRPWPADMLKALEAEHPTALVNSCFTVHRDYRKRNGWSELPVSYVLGCVSVLHQLEVGAPLMLGMMRRERSMNKLGSLLGSTTLLTTTYNGEETDLVVFRSEDVREASRTFPPEVFDIFAGRRDELQGGNYGSLERTDRIAALPLRH